MVNPMTALETNPSDPTKREIGIRARVKRWGNSGSPNGTSGHLID
jgi:hypothetical protein